MLDLCSAVPEHIVAKAAQFVAMQAFTRTWQDTLHLARAMLVVLQQLLIENLWVQDADASVLRRLVRSLTRGPGSVSAGRATEGRT